MMTAETSRTQRPDPPALAAAIRLLDDGLWPLPVTANEDRREWVRSPGKQPAGGTDWGKERWTEGTLRAFWRKYPNVGVGIKLGEAGKVVDIEVDDPETGEGTLLELFGGEVVETRGWSSARGRHLLFHWDARLADFGGVIENNPLFLGVGLRFGTAGEEGEQVQSVVPPSPITLVGEDGPQAGRPREWNGVETIARLPECFFAEVARRLAKPPPTPPPTSGPRPGPGFTLPPNIDQGHGPLTWDKAEVKERILPHALGLAKEWGLRVVSDHPNAKGFVVCRAIDREDRTPSAALNLETGVYTDRGTGTDLSIFHLAIALNAYPDFPTAVNTLGQRFGIPGRPLNGQAPGQKPPNNRFGPFVPEEFLGDYEWEMPVGLELMPAEVFPLEVFPVSLRELCEAASATMQTPVDYFASAALGLAGGVVGRTVALGVTTTWEVGPNLYIAIIGPPGSKKSPALKVMAGPLWALDRELREEYRREKKEARDEGEDGRAAPPTLRQLTLDDTTREAVAKILSENPRGIVMVRDELTGWVASLNAYRQGKGDDKQFWMSLYTGALVKVTRKGADEPIVIPHPCGSVIGCLTPDTLPQLRDKVADDGWLDRLLFSYPEATPRRRVWTRAEVPQELLDDWTHAVRKLWDRPMVMDDLESPLRPFFVHLSDQAEVLWASFYDRHHAEQCEPDFPDSLLGPWSKLEGATLRFALILSQLHQAYDPTDDGPPRDIDPLALHGALALVAYFKAHFRRSRMRLLERPESLTDQAWRVLNWIRSLSETYFSARDVLREFRGLRDSSRDSVLRQLIEHRYIRFVGEFRAGETVGRTSKIYEINPRFSPQNS